MTPRTTNIRQALFAFIEAQRFPCVGAKSAAAKGQIEVFEGADLRCGSSDKALLEALYGFIARYRDGHPLFCSFAAVFRTPMDLGEEAYEAALWDRLGALHRLDARRHGWSPEVSADPASPRFGFSLGAQAFYIVGLHPGASRTARRFPHPAIVFNAHRQFSQLRREGRYERIRERILARDQVLDGFANPMLAEHGKVSEAPQYSGRRVGADWQCPFRPQK
ncbi:MAG: YqcI/YcgG family protein [Alphaproteobacteria bacterium]|nr:YqcI/YcgG family protein [Alphaproteobacteria bacterium]